jgi:hypothetical protein
LDYNYIRLKTFIGLHRSAYLRIVSHQPSTDLQCHVNATECSQLLEFYLQMDVDLFYMKTCLFLQARPRSMDEGIFCIDVPQCQYTMKPCEHCLLCRSSAISGRRRTPSIEFNCYQKHCVVNDHESILNCSTTSSTINIIHALTCPYEKYDDISNTRTHLWARLSSHYYYANPSIHGALLGEHNFIEFYGRKNQGERS